MNLFNYSFNEQKVKFIDHSINIRIAYLLADNVLIGGDLFAYIFWKNRTDFKNPKQAAKALIAFNNVEEEKALVRDMVKQLNQLSAIKHKPASVINMIKKTESHFINIWKSFNGRVIRLMSETGIIEISKIHDSKNVYIYGAINLPERNDKEHYPCSKFLLLDADDEDEPWEKNCFMFTNQFNQMQQDADAKLDETAYWHEPILQFNNLNTLKGAELQLLHLQLRPAAAPFCEAVEAWAAKMNELTYEDSRAWFRQQVLPAAQNLQQAIDDNDLLKQISALVNDNSLIKLYAGDITMQASWQFFEYVGSMHPETKAILQQPENQLLAQKRKPFFHIELEQNTDDTWQNLFNTHEPAAVKKSLSFD